MAVFPDIKAFYGSEIIPTFNTLKLGPTDGDFIQRRKKRTVPLYQFRLKFNVLSQSDIKTLYDFFISMSGCYGSFAFFDFDYRDWSIIVGTGDGSTTSFDLKGKETYNRIVKVNGIQKTEGTDYTFYQGLGADGQDKITFNSAPATGDIIIADFTGRRYFPNCIFLEDVMSIESFSHLLYSTGLTIQEVSS
jgi:hypothetical protein